MRTLMNFSLSRRKNALVQWELRAIGAFLNDFEEPKRGMRRTVRLSPSGEVLLVNNFPLPDGYRPDYIDLLVGVSNYPERPPIGIYILNKNNEALIEQLKVKFNAYRDTAMHEADPLPGYSWICFSYSGNVWRYCAKSPNRGDNVRKFLGSFFAQLMN